MAGHRWEGWHLSLWYILVQLLPLKEPLLWGTPGWLLCIEWGLPLQDDGFQGSVSPFYGEAQHGSLQQEAAFVLAFWRPPQPCSLPFWIRLLCKHKQKGRIQWQRGLVSYSCCTMIQTTSTLFLSKTRFLLFRGTLCFIFSTAFSSAYLSFFSFLLWSWIFIYACCNNSS